MYDKMLSTVNVLHYCLCMCNCNLNFGMLWFMILSYVGASVLYIE